MSRDRAVSLAIAGALALYAGWLFWRGVEVRVPVDAGVHTLAPPRRPASYGNVR